MRHRAQVRSYRGVDEGGGVSDLAASCDRCSFGTRPFTRNLAAQKKTDRALEALPCLSHH
ncbi:hypothetical protein, partial [Xanthomonas perforans]